MLIGCNGATVFSPWGNNTTRANYYIFVCPLCYNTIRTECYFIKGYLWDKKVPLFPIFIVQPCLNVHGGIFDGGGGTNFCHLWKYKSHVETAHKIFFRVRKEIGWQYDKDFKQFHGLQYLWTTRIFYCGLQYLIISSNCKQKVFSKMLGQKFFLSQNWKSVSEAV